MSFAYGFGLPHWQPLSGGFSPAGLFQAGVIGTFYDPSDLSTLFTTSTGATPCAVPGSGSQVLVGLMLDKSQGLVLGSELLADSGFNNAASWQSNAGVTISGGEAIWNTATNSVYVRQPLITTANTYYEFTVVCSSYTAGTVFVGIGAGGTNLTSFPINAVGTVTFRINVEANSGTVWLLTPTGGAQLSITSFSVRQVSGNHAIAFNDTTARPELSARVNLLTYSEQFNNAAWTASNLTVTANTAVAPDGATTADTLDDASASFGALSQLVSSLANSAYNFSVYIKSSGVASDVRIDLYTTVGEQFFAIFNSGTGAYVSGNGVIYTTTSVGNGWYRVSLSASGSGNTTVRVYPAGGSAGATGSIFIWGADLRPANIGSAIPAYQRIADQYTYDSNGFPSYLRFDGVDDSMYTPASINFSGTDKMSVFAGVRKLSDAATSVIAELSADKNSNNGVFLLNTEAAPRWYWESKGTLIAATNSGAVTTFAAPITSVVTGIGDIGGDSSILRVNSSQLGSTASDQGTGNYGTYPLYIGSRNNSGLRFNGHLYSLITAGTQLQSGSITATEQYVAEKTGVQI